MFYTAKKFRAVVNELDGTHGDVVIFFEPDNSFTTKFFNIGVKPIALIVYDEKGNEELTTHSGLLAMFEGRQPIVTINPALVDIMRNQKLQAFILKEPRTSKNGYEYVPCWNYSKCPPDALTKIIGGKILDNE